jgi:hypothetical protein
MKTIAAVSALWLAIAAASLADDKADEIKRLQGRFERTFTNAAGTMFRTVQDIVGDQSTVTAYDDVRNVVAAHTATIKVEKRGSVRVLSFFNLVVTAGAEKGHTEPGTSSYIYRFDGSVFSEAWGLLEGDDSPPRILYWRKLKTEG